MAKVKTTLKSMDDPDYTYWQALYMACYASRLYIDVIKRWSGFGFNYLILLMLLGSIPLSIQHIHQLNHYIRHHIIAPIAQIPPLMIQNGQIHFKQQKTTYIKNTSGKNAIEINPGTYHGFSKNDPDLFLIITTDTIYFKSSLNPISPLLPPSSIQEPITSYPLDSHDHEIFSGQDWVKHARLHWIYIFGDLITLLSLWATLTGFYLIFNLLIASIGRIIASTIIKYRITFKTAFRLSTVASTAPYWILILCLSFGAIFLRWAPII